MTTKKEIDKMINELWHADIEIVTNALAKACIEAQFSSVLSVFDIITLDQGWDNIVFLVNNTLIFRFPRRKIAVPLIERENQLLVNLHHLFEIDIPYPQYLGKPSDIYPYPFQGYQRIVGDTAYHAQLTEKERIKSIKTIATFLKKLHSINRHQANVLGAREQLFDRTKKQRIFEQLRERIVKIKQKNLVALDDGAIHHLFELAANADLSKQILGLVHGDLYSKHLLFDKRKLTGVIDWGDVGINHPAVDLAVIHSFYSQHSHAEFFNYYGEVEPDIARPT